jgi:hypothetical protein
MIKENLYRGYTGVETENLPDRFYVLGAPMNYNGGQLMLLKNLIILHITIWYILRLQSIFLLEMSRMKAIFTMIIAIRTLRH